ncbi:MULTISPECIES: acyl-CoA dehydrogenase family protein [unclassified Mycobacterium]|uniref:acyl-CoA dehydrogenase family protein n=1 Tax=unclassified Mycobacterium TaxID=2642494 RepID=UPI0029C7B123|nr:MULTISPECIES: acyl-CoA dehydrogenase family protein [unclassified Mycobacterium]
MNDDSTSADDTFAVLSANQPELAELRASIREFLRDDSDEYGWRPAVDSWLSCWDEEFSARLGDAGFLGLTIPTEYGGHGKGHLHRYVVIEELLACGAPVAAHWMADRQVAPALLAYGSQEQREQLLPRITAGRLYSAVGMSEHIAGSDLAAAQTKATRVDGGWLLNGAKVWTSGAHHAHVIVTLARTAPTDPGHRHAGFSQFLVDRAAAGIAISPIALMSGEHHFNEVVFDDVFVSDGDVLGYIGNGWHQVTAELSFERSGPERILTTVPLIVAAVRALTAGAETDNGTAAILGSLVAELISLRQLSISVAHSLAAGDSATNRAALVKDLGTRFEQRSVDLIEGLLNSAPGSLVSDRPLGTMLDQARLHKPMFTLRGGTNEVLRSVVARGMGLR